MQHLSKHVIVALLFISGNLVAMNDTRDKPFLDASDIDLDSSDEDFEEDLGQDGRVEPVRRSSTGSMSIEELVKQLRRYNDLQACAKQGKGDEGQ